MVRKQIKSPTIPSKPEVPAAEPAPSSPPSVSGSFTITDDPSPDKRHDEFFKWIGICIKEWAHIENSIYAIFENVLRADPKHAAIIYFRTPTIENRLTLVEEIIETVLPSRQKKDGGHDHPDLIAWTKLVKDTRALLPVRNLLAHDPSRYSIEITVQVDDKTGGWTKSNEKSWINVQQSDAEQRRGRPRRSIKEDELKAHFADLRKIVERFISMHLLVKTKYGPPTRNE